MVHKYGFHGSGPGQFAFSDDGPSGGIGFTPDSHTLLVGGAGDLCMCLCLCLARCCLLLATR